MSTMCSLLSNALDSWDTIGKFLRNNSDRLILFLDYDGTLSEIARTPEEAILSPKMCTLLHSLSNQLPTAIVTGRSIENITRLVHSEVIYFAGNHGFDIRAPNGDILNLVGSSYLSIINEAYDNLVKDLSFIEGVLIENNKLSISVHYRQVSDAKQIEFIRSYLSDFFAKEEYSELYMTEMKKVFEIRPQLEWNKGKAVCWLYSLFASKSPRHLSEKMIPIYIGDDTTDEDAFKALADKGITILVSEKEKKTHAQFSLTNPSQVYSFLNSLSEIYK